MLLNTTINYFIISCQENGQQFKNKYKIISISALVKNYQKLITQLISQGYCAKTKTIHKFSSRIIFFSLKRW